MATDRNGDTHCDWCGGDIPHARAHLMTCASKCAGALGADNRRLAREAAKKAARERHAAVPVVPVEPLALPAPDTPKCTRCCIRRTDGEHAHCGYCRAVIKRGKPPRQLRGKPDRSGERPEISRRCPECLGPAPDLRARRCAECRVETIRRSREHAAARVHELKQRRRTSRGNTNATGTTDGGSGAAT